MRILIATSASGGHVFPALAVALWLIDKGWEVSWLGTTHGMEGGHRLAREASSISVGEIWRVIDGPWAPPAKGAGGGSISICFNSIWEDVEKAIAGVVDNISLANLCRRAEVQRKVLDFTI